ncbi:hypothetical protein GGR54DRAFT_274505 [Hypoxylon sp. NC1633]|nr:hypothetical protein GGR54DRAFT_274505 [Hypoxylon sp. NC1633]
MPSVTSFERPTLSPSKKRRRDEDRNEVQVSVATQYNDPQNFLSDIDNNERLILSSASRGTTSLHNMPRKGMPLPLPAAKRFRFVGEEEGQIHNYNNKSSTAHSPQQSQFSHAHPEASTPPALPPHITRADVMNPSTSTRTTHTPALLSPCHICHRKPTKKSDLDSFADCMGCGQRACFVCIRACQGWLSSPSCYVPDDEDTMSASFTMHDVDEPPEPEEPSRQRQKQGKGGGWTGRGHRGMVCSRCCVERGSEGDVVCLGCLAGMEGA